MPAVDVLLATWNGSRFIDDLLTSLATQRLPVAKLFVADDGSTDGTVERVRERAAALDLDAEIISEATVGGAAPNFSRLLDHARSASTADWFAFADQDDQWHPRKLERSVAAADATAPSQPIAVFHDARVVDSRGTVVHGSHLAHRGLPPVVPTIPRLLMQNPASGNTLMFNRALLDRLVPMPEAAPMHDWWTALVGASFGELRFVNEQLVDYRQHDANERGASGIGVARIAQEARSALTSFSRTRVNDRFALAEAFALAHPHLTEHPAHHLRDIRNMPIGQRQIKLVQGGFLHAGVVRNLAMLAFA